MAHWIYHEEGCTTSWRTMPMRTRLHNINNYVNLLALRDITIFDLDEVDAWMHAIDMLPKEREDACEQILTYGSFIVCNIEHRLELCCHRR